MATTSDKGLGASKMQCARVEGSGVSLTEIRFGLLTSEDIVKLSVQATEKPAQVTDSCLGLPLPDGVSCSYCGTAVAEECPGHFGHVNLATPVYHPEHVSRLCSILQRVCLNCGNLRKKRGKRSGDSDPASEDPDKNGQSNEDNKTSHQNPSVALPKQPKSIQPKPVFSKKSKQELQGSYIIIDDDDGDELIVDVMHEDDNDYEPKQTVAPEVGCLFCKGKYKHPDVKEVVVKISKTRTEFVKGVQLHYRGEDRPPPGYWKFIPSGGTCAGARTVELLPFQARQILRRIPARVLAAVGVDATLARPEAYVIDKFPVPPNCMQTSGDFVCDWKDDNAKVISSQTASLKSLLTKNADVKFSRRRASKAVTNEPRSLQLQISQYFRLKGCKKVKGNLEPFVAKNASPDFGAIWKGRMKDSILGKMTQYCALALLTGDPHIAVGEIMIPAEIARQVTVPEIVTVFNRDKMQTLVDKLQGGFIERNKMILDLREHVLARRKLEVGDIVHRTLQDGDVLYANRTPSIHKHSIISFKVRSYGGMTIRINPLVCKPFGADFDGDRLDVFFPQTQDVIVECNELMSIQKQFISSQSGSALISLTQDCLLAAYKLVSDHFLFATPVFSQLVLHSGTQKTLPSPAIVKAHSKGPFWTAYQAFSLLLPSKFSFDAPSGVLISQGELLRAGDDASWLKTILLAIHDRNGVEEAIIYLNSCSKMLNELLLIEGFSTGLGDFNMDSKPGFRTAVSDIFDKAAGSSDLSILQDVQKEVERVIEAYTGDKNSLQAMMKAGSKGSVSHMRKHVGCLGTQLYRNDETVPGFPRFIEQSFFRGLDPAVFFHHSICSRDILMKQLHLSQAGTLGDMLVKHLGDVYVAYDGTLRHRCNHQIISFGSGGSALPGEAVGILAAQAVRQQAYEAVLDAPHNPSKYQALFTETLQTQSHIASKSALKEDDKTVVIRLKACTRQGCHCLESRLLQLKHRLQRVTLEELATKIVIEWIGEGEFWFCHFVLNKDKVETLNLVLESIPRYLEKFIKVNYSKVDFRCKHLNMCETVDAPCIHLGYFTPKDDRNDITRFDDAIANSLKFLKDTLLPKLMKVSITGNNSIKSVSIIWEEKDDLPAVHNEQSDGELVLRAVMVTKGRSEAFNVIKKNVDYLSDYVDWGRSGPCSVQGVYDVFGIEAAYQCIYQRLARIMRKLDVRVDPAHLALVAEFATHTGSVLGFTDLGFGEFLKCIGASAPFLRAAIKAPLARFEMAAQSGARDPLDSIVSSTAWGKRPPIGTESDFKLVWKEKGVEDRTLDMWDKLDVHQFLACVPDAAPCTPETPAISEDRDNEACFSPFVDRSYSGPQIINPDGDGQGGTEGGWGTNEEKPAEAGWGGTGDNAGMQEDNGWGESMEEPTADGGWEDASGQSIQVNDKEKSAVGDGWGDQPMDTEDNGWGEVQTDTVQEKATENEDSRQVEESTGDPTRRLQALADQEKALADQKKLPADEERFPGDEERFPAAENEDAEEDFRRKRPFKPTGSNLVPLGDRKWKGKLGKSIITSEGEGTTDNASERTSSEGPRGFEATSNTVPLGQHKGSKAWNTGEANNKDDGGNGWGAPNETGEASGWGVGNEKDSNAENKDEWGGWDAGGDEAKEVKEDNKDNEKPMGTYKRPHRTQDGPKRAPDPVRIKFNNEVHELVTTAKDVLSRYEAGDRLSEDDETFILESVLVHHPDHNVKLGAGISFIKVDRPPRFPEGKCLFIVRKDGTEEDFSYHKCLRAYVEKNFPPEYLDSYDFLFGRKKGERRKPPESSQDPPPAATPAPDAVPELDAPLNGI